MEAKWVEAHQIVIIVRGRYFIEFSPLTGDLRTAAYLAGARRFSSCDKSIGTVIRALKRRGLSCELAKVRLQYDF